MYRSVLRESGDSKKHTQEVAKPFLVKWHVLWPFRRYISKHRFIQGVFFPAQLDLGRRAVAKVKLG